MLAKRERELTRVETLPLVWPGTLIDSRELSSNLNLLVYCMRGMRVDESLSESFAVSSCCFFPAGSDKKGKKFGDQGIGHFGRYHNTPCLFRQILHKHCFQFLLGHLMVSRENKNSGYAKFGGTNKEYYGIFRSGLLDRLVVIFVFPGVSQALSFVCA